VSDIHLNFAAYDCLGTVQLVLNVSDIDLPAENVDRFLRVTNSIVGTGEDDLREWARDALVAMLEAL